MTHKSLPLALILAFLACRPSETATRQPSSKLAPDAAPVASDLTAEQLIEKYETARGGKEKLSGLHAVKMTGTMVTREVASAPTTLILASDRYLRRIEQGPNVTMIHVVDGTTAWEVNPRNGIVKPTPMSAQDAARFRHFADPRGPLVGAAAKGNKVEVVGRQAWRNSQVYKLKITYGDGSVHSLYLDSQTFLPVRLVSSLYVPPLHRDIDVEFVYSDFRDVEGVKWPFAEEGSAPEVNFKQTLTWTKIEANPPLDDSAFKPS
jgi:hypothetical protein